MYKVGVQATASPVASGRKRLKSRPETPRDVACGRVSRRILLGLPEFCLQFAEFAEPCRTPAELFRGSLMTGKNYFELLSTRRI